jgi:hypothetical protein
MAELDDMGQFVGSDWVWHPDFEDAIRYNCHTPMDGVEGSPGNICIPEPFIGQAGIVMTEGRVDNRIKGAWANDLFDSRLVFQGELSDGVQMPVFFKYTIGYSNAEWTVAEGANCDENGSPTDCVFNYVCPINPDVGISTYSYVGIGNGDWNIDGANWYYAGADGQYTCDMGTQDEMLCSDCTPQLVSVPDNEFVGHPGTTYPTDAYYAAHGDLSNVNPGDPFPFDFTAAHPSTPITLDMVDTMEWVTGNQVRQPWYMENDTFYWLPYNMDTNSFDDRGPRWSPRNIYSKPFDGHVGIGDNVFRVTLKTGESIDINAHILTNTLMPYLEAKTTVTQLEILKTLGKSGKVMAQVNETEVDNITAKPIINDDGEEVLLIQFAEPDRAMELTSPYKKLRIWVAEPDMLTPRADGDEITLDFLWLNCPVNTGSIVVPHDAWEWIKAKADVQAAGYVEVGGMYREQMPALKAIDHEGNPYLDWRLNYHNRGYIESIRVPIN